MCAAGGVHGRRRGVEKGEGAGRGKSECTGGG